ncbi:multicopper oxidase family protein [Neisseriaceae bacterium TC5R-5]|nr:multicopper oxidase family protein [Neisseriaceae bacterium TC5R-5]
MSHDMAQMVTPSSSLKVVAESPLLAESALPKGSALQPLSQLANNSHAIGHFSATLTAQPVDIELVPGKQTTVWAYNQQLPGPLIEAFEGDTVEIRLINQLAQATTIHWHGLPVPADQDGGPHHAVAAGAERLYRFTLPKGSAGTYWYHPHPHGDTPEQVYRGLAGLFIVRSKDDPLTAFSEQHLAISDLRLTESAQIPDNTALDWMNGREGQFALVNGQREPVITIVGKQRLRIWNACSARYLQLHIPGMAFSLVGTDGGLLEQPVTMQEIVLAPAQRIEILVGDGQMRHTSLQALSYNREKMGGVEPEKDRTLAQLHFVAGPLPVTPQHLRKLPELGPATAHKKVEFNETMSMEGGKHQMQFLVNGKSFDMNRIDLESHLGEVEIWEVFNNSHMDHPFHLHGTQFEVLDSVLDKQTIPATYRARRDTINLRPYETVHLKTVHTQKGVWMYHCHILEHEGQGMMAQLQVK